MPPLRVLLYSEACNPSLASEPGLIFQHIKAIVEEVDEAVVVTQIRNREAISTVGIGKAKVLYLDTEHIVRPLLKIASALKMSSSTSTALQYPYFIAFERALWKLLRADLAGGKFDIVHRVGPISAALPSPLAKWTPVPFVIGPVNGGLPYPPGFGDVLHREREWLRHVRGAYQYLPYVRSTYREAAAIQAAFSHTIANLPPGNFDRIIDVPENGADPFLFPTPSRSPAGTRLRVLFVGRLVPFKCADVILSAFAASARLRAHHLLIVGDGPERPTLEAFVQENDLADSVTFCGWRSQQEVARMMSEADVFAFPSIRDSGAGVIVEAMMSGLPSVVIDYGPCHELIDGHSGIRVPLGARADHVAGFVAALELLVGEPAIRTALGQAARARAISLLSWKAHARKTVEIYRWVLGQLPDKPRGLLEPSD